MPKYIILANKTEARQLEKLLRRLLDLPQKGVNIGGGIHATPDLAMGVGFTIRAALFVKHPTDGRYAVRVTPRMVDEWRDHKDRLTAAQRTAIQDRLATQAEIAAEWKRTDPDTGEVEVPEDQEIEPIL